MSQKHDQGPEKTKAQFSIIGSWKVCTLNSLHFQHFCTPISFLCGLVFSWTLEKLLLYVCVCMYVQNIILEFVLPWGSRQGILKAQEGWASCIIYISVAVTIASSLKPTDYPFLLDSSHIGLGVNCTGPHTESRPVHLWNTALNSVCIYLSWSRLLMALNSRSETFLIQTPSSCVSFLLPWNIVATRPGG